jgi:hypothetical protein
MSRQRSVIRCRVDAVDELLVALGSLVITDLQPAQYRSLLL